MSVTKSKFESEKGASALDVDDPDFWSKVMPDFVTPEILINKLAVFGDDAFVILVHHNSHTALTSMISKTGSSSTNCL